MAELKLAKAYRYPDVTIGGGYAVQGPQGPGSALRQAEVSVQSAEADIRKSILEVQTQVDVTYRNLTQSRRLVEAYRAGVLEDARETLTIVEKAYERGGATILELLDAARTSRTIQQNCIEALFHYQRTIFQLESAVGREIT